jgi:hypothetical protein
MESGICKCGELNAFDERPDPFNLGIWTVIMNSTGVEISIPPCPK